MTTIEGIATKLRDLSPDMLDEVETYVELLIHKRQGAGSAVPKSSHLRQNWAGALAHLSTQHGSVDLQHQAATWMAEDALNSISGNVSR